MTTRRDHIKNRTDSVFSFESRRVDNKPYPVVVCRCSNCGDTDEKKGTPAVPTNVVAAQFRRRDWYIANRETYALCPKCIKTEEEVREVSKATPQSGEAIRKQRKIFQLLDDHFDIEKGRFADGWSDKKIADETSMAESHIVKIREEAYGPLKADPEIIALGERIRAMSAEIEREIAEVRALADATEKSLREKLVEIERKYTSLSMKR